MTKRESFGKIGETRETFDDLITQVQIIMYGLPADDLRLFLRRPQNSEERLKWAELHRRISVELLERIKDSPRLKEVFSAVILDPIIFSDILTAAGEPEMFRSFLDGLV
jgi:hypothetical protein